MTSTGKLEDITEIIEKFKKNESLRELQNRDSLEILAQTNILHEHNEKLSNHILDQKQVLLDLNKQCASKSHEVKLKKVLMKNLKDAQECYFNKESERLDEMCKSYEDQWEFTRKGIASLYKEAHQLNLKKSANKLQGNIFHVDTFEFEEMQMKADETSQASDYSALSIDDWSEQELIDVNASQLEHLNETNDDFTEDTQNWEIMEIQGASDSGRNRHEFPTAESFARRNVTNTVSKRLDQFSSNEQPLGGVTSWHQKGVEGFKLTSISGGRSSYQQKSVTSAVVPSPFDDGVSQSATAVRVGTVQRSAAMNHRRPEPAIEPAKITNTEEDSYWDFDVGDCFDEFEDDWHDTSNPPHKNSTDDDESYSKKQQYVFQPRRSLMK